MVGRAVFPHVFEAAMSSVESAHNLGLPAASAEVAQQCQEPRSVVFELFATVGTEALCSLE